MHYTAKSPDHQPRVNSAKGSISSHVELPFPSLCHPMPRLSEWLSPISTSVRLLALLRELHIFTIRIEVQADERE